MNAESICFIGVTSPSSASTKVVEAIARMKEKALKRPVDILMINTDGWIEGEDAVRHKLSLIKQVKPDVLIGIQQENELTFLLGAVIETQKLPIESSPAVRKRDREERKLLREIGYKKYLKGAAVESFPISWVKVSGLPLGNGAPPARERVAKIVEQIGTTPMYMEETPDSVFIVLGKEQWADEEIARSIGETLNKKVKIVWQGDEEGLLVALHDKDENFLSLGILEQIDYERRVFKVYTRVKKDVASIHVGQIKVDKSGKELGQSEAFSDYL
jgi:polynucleotide 5'-hydroxyl-kinase GRC3/NOL9